MPLILSSANNSGVTWVKWFVHMSWKYSFTEFYICDQNTYLSLKEYHTERGSYFCKFMKTDWGSIVFQRLIISLGDSDISRTVLLWWTELWASHSCNYATRVLTVLSGLAGTIINRETINTIQTCPSLPTNSRNSRRKEIAMYGDFSTLYINNEFSALQWC